MTADLRKRRRSAFAAPTLSSICPCPQASRRPLARTATDTVRRTAWPAQTSDVGGSWPATAYQIVARVWQSGCSLPDAEPW